MTFQEMRISPLKHPVAVLRQITGLSQREFAELSGCSRPTIQAVELGKLKLSERLARSISLATGIAAGWLLDSDPKAPPVTELPSGINAPRSPYTYESFEKYRASLENQIRTTLRDPKKYTYALVPSENEEAQSRDAELVARCAGVLAEVRQDERGPVIRWRLGRFLDGLAEEIKAGPKPKPPKRESTKPRRGVQ